MALPAHFLGSIIETCEIIADRAKFAAGLGRSANPVWTGIPSYAELMSQVFDDLRARESVIDLVDKCTVPPRLRIAILTFISALDFYGSSVGGDDVSFASPEWQFVEASARAVAAAYKDARETGFNLDSYK
jgi:hypothetical protein